MIKNNKEIETINKGFITGRAVKKYINFFCAAVDYPSLTLPKKERTENKLKKSRFYADFFELFLLTNTENYDIIYLI